MALAVLFNMQTQQPDFIRTNTLRYSHLRGLRRRCDKRWALPNSAQPTVYFEGGLSCVLHAYEYASLFAPTTLDLAGGGADFLPPLFSRGGLGNQGGYAFSAQQAFEILEHQKQVVRVGRAWFEFPRLVPAPGGIIFGMHQQAADARNVGSLRGA